MSAYSELLAIKERFDVFLEKLKARAEELEQDTLSMVQEVYDEDTTPYKRDYLSFKAGIEGQFNNLRTKVTDVFEQQVYPRRDLVSTMSDEWDSYSELYDKIYKKKEDFIDLMYKKSKGIFKSVKEISSESQLKEVLEEYEDIKKAFSCTQCGADIEIKQMYFVSTYVECEYCRTQNTFKPSSKMRTLPFLAREVGEERHRDLEKLCRKEDEKDDTTVKSFWLYYQYRAMVWLESCKIVPVLKKENADVFYREMHDALSYNRKTKFEESEKFYEKVLNFLDFHKLTVEVSPEDKKLLLELSINYLKRLGHFDKYQDLYNEKINQLKNKKNEQL